MNVCRWCTPSGLDATEYLKSYASKQLSPEDLEGSNDDLCYCLECVVEYHKAREKLPSLHQVMEHFDSQPLLSKESLKPKENFRRGFSGLTSVYRGAFCRSCVIMTLGSMVCWLLTVLFFFFTLGCIEQSIKEDLFVLHIFKVVITKVTDLEITAWNKSRDCMPSKLTALLLKYWLLFSFEFCLFLFCFHFPFTVSYDAWVSELWFCICVQDRN